MRGGVRKKEPGRPQGFKNQFLHQDTWNLRLNIDHSFLAASFESLGTKDYYSAESFFRFLNVDMSDANKEKVRWVEMSIWILGGDLPGFRRRRKGLPMSGELDDQCKGERKLARSTKTPCRPR